MTTREISVDSSHRKNAANKHVVFYHHPCSDGHFARLVAEKALSPNARVLAVPSPPGQLPQGFSTAEVVAPGDSVWILDTCYPEPVLDELASRSGQVVRVLDHHLFSEKVVSRRPGCVHDKKRSGCVIAWEHFFPGQEVPKALLYVQDRDLWRWKLAPASKLFCAHLYHSVPFESYDAYLDPERGLDLVREAVEKGAVACQDVDALVERFVANARFCVWMGVKTAVAQVDKQYASEAGDRLLQKYDALGLYACDCAFLWFASANSSVCSVSLRSRGTYDSEDELVSVSADVDKLARFFGGGGHATAAGFTCQDVDRVLLRTFD